MSMNSFFIDYMPDMRSWNIAKASVHTIPPRRLTPIRELVVAVTVVRLSVAAIVFVFVFLAGFFVGIGLYVVYFWNINRIVIE